MVSLSWTIETHDSVSLVELVVRNPMATSRRVRVANRLNGPVWPPRQNGVPEAGWDDGGFEGVVGPESQLALGYASSGNSVEPPAEVVWTERAATGSADDSCDGVPDVESTADGVVRALGDPRPPADAVPVATRRTNVEQSLPEDVEAWLSDVEQRVEQCEALANAASLPAATEAVGAVGGLDEVEALQSSVERDCETLVVAADRTSELQERAAQAVDGVPMDVFRRLA